MTYWELKENSIVEINTSVLVWTNSITVVCWCCLPVGSKITQLWWGPSSALLGWSSWGTNQLGELFIDLVECQFVIQWPSVWCGLIRTEKEVNNPASIGSRRWLILHCGGPQRWSRWGWPPHTASKRINDKDIPDATTKVGFNSIQFNSIHCR